MTEIDRLAGLFAALGADDPQSWARSEAEENIPQLARYRLLRMLWQDIDGWSSAAPDWIGTFQRDGSAAGAVERALRLGVTPDDLGAVAREVSRETVFALLHRLCDPTGEDLGAGVEEQLPGWCLAETSPSGEHTGRHLDALYEDLNGLDPRAQESEAGYS
ncbi:hypothetical protein [Streptomyces sp. SYSU K217416]